MYQIATWLELRPESVFEKSHELRASSREPEGGSEGAGERKALG